MDEKKIKAGHLLSEFKGDNYVFGLDCLNKVGVLAKKLGNEAILIISQESWAKELKSNILKYLDNEDIKLLKIINEAHPNAPREDVYSLQDEIVKLNPELIIVVGGGSTIDCAKAASVLSTYSHGEHNIDTFFGIGKVSKYKEKSGKNIIPILAVEIAASSGAHLTKYSNITETKTNQKKLIIDDVIIPSLALFDYSVTKTMGINLTSDGALDGIAHCLEVYYGATDETIDRIEEISLLAIEMIVNTLPKAIEEPGNLEYRELLGLGTDLGGYAIMLGGTNGAHLTSFSLVDILSHGRACAILNPYYTVFFAPVIERQLKILAKIYSKYIDKGFNINDISCRELAEIVANGMINFSIEIGFPTNLSEVEGFTDDYIDKAISAAKNPQLKMKLKNMPVPLDISLIDEYMRPVLEAAKNGDLSLIKNL